MKMGWVQCQASIHRGCHGKVTGTGGQNQRCNGAVCDAQHQNQRRVGGLRGEVATGPGEPPAPKLPSGWLVVGSKKKAKADTLKYKQEPLIFKQNSGRGF